MKTLFTFLLFLCTLTSFSQSDKVVGDYNLTMNTTKSDLFEYKLTLWQDGTFLFHYYSNIKKGVPVEVNKFGKGSWTIKGTVISFHADKKYDFDEKHTLDLTNSKARFLVRSDRDKTEQASKTRLQFLQSEIFWIKKIKMNKV